VLMLERGPSKRIVAEGAETAQQQEAVTLPL
jgi:hypothetical protein